jgi:hypothetical protein
MRFYKRSVGGAFGGKSRRVRGVVCVALAGMALTLAASPARASGGSCGSVSRFSISIGSSRGGISYHSGYRPAYRPVRECDWRDAEYRAGRDDGYRAGHDRGYWDGYYHHAACCESARGGCGRSIWYESGYRDGYGSGYECGYVRGREARRCAKRYERHCW